MRKRLGIALAVACAVSLGMSVLIETASAKGSRRMGPPDGPRPTAASSGPAESA